MNEMLGNQYFLARKFNEALNELEIALKKNLSNKSIQKKLIICYIKTNQIQKALKLFINLIDKDIFFIINTNLVFDDCPCPEIIYELENSLEVKNEEEKNLVLGMLWLYCDINKSIKFFSLLPAKEETDFILNKLHKAHNQISKRGKNGKQKTRQKRILS